MIIYNQTSTFKKYLSGMLIGVLVLPAIWLFTQGLIVYGVVLLIVYLAFETSRTGVDFNFSESKISDFREVLFFMKIRKQESTQLNKFSHYRVSQGTDEQSVMANYVQNSTVTQEYHTLELFNKAKGEFSLIVKGDISQIQPVLSQLEEQNIRVKD